MDRKYLVRWIVALLIISFVTFIVTALLYNAWFDTLDSIKYNKKFSPETFRESTWQRLVYWSVWTSGFAGAIYCIIKIVKRPNRYKIQDKTK